MVYSRILLPSDPFDAFTTCCYLTSSEKLAIRDVLYDENPAFPREIIKQFFPEGKLWSIPATQEGHRFRFAEPTLDFNLAIIDQENRLFLHPTEIFSKELARIAPLAIAYHVVELGRLTPAERQAVVSYLDKENSVGITFTATDFKHPLILDFTSQFTLLQQVELVKQAQGYIGADTILGAVAARLFFGKDLRVKSDHFSLTRFYPHQTDHCIKADLLEIL